MHAVPGFQADLHMLSVVISLYTKVFPQKFTSTQREMSQFYYKSTVHLVATRCASERYKVTNINK